MDGNLFLGFMFGALIIGGLLGVTIGQPYPVHLEEWERNSFQSRLDNKDIVLADSIENWKEYTEKVKQEQIDICTSEKDKQRDRFAGINQNLIDQKESSENKWLDAIKDLNSTISTGFEDINALIADINGC